MESLSTLVFILLGLALLFKYLKTERASRLPGPKSYPFVGAVLQLKTGRLHEQFSDFARQYGKLFGIQLFRTTSLVLNTAEMVHKAYNADHYKYVFNRRPHVFLADHLYAGKAIVFQNNTKLHGDLRRVLSKGLHVYGDGTPRCENIIATEIHRVIDQIENSAGKEFEVVGLARQSLSNTISIVLIGERATDTDVKNFFDFVEGQNTFLRPLPNTVLVHFPYLIHLPSYKKSYDEIMMARHNILQKYFYAIKSSRKTDTIRGLVDWYLQEQEREQNEGREPVITDDVIMAAVLEFVSAGIVTTASVLPSAFLCLVNNHGYQTKIHEELDRVIGTGREPSIHDRKDCELMEAVMMEVMRLIPPNPFSLPRSTSKDVQFEGYDIKANTQVIMNNWFLHHDEKVWGDPWVFRPDRFLDDTGKLLPSTHISMKSWLIFGTGRRKCPGISLALHRLFLYLAMLFQKWSFIPSPGKCGTCDPRAGYFECDLFIVKPQPFYCIAQKRY